MLKDNNKPLVSLLVIAYKQERFIREAVQSALAQTYQPLEVILSDDFSPDRTFEIMREMAETYRGPHRVVLNRNPTNLGIGGHINRVVEISKGELLVCAAGDDISFAERCSLCAAAWEASGRAATSIHSHYIQIDEQGNAIEDLFPREERLSNTELAVEQKVNASDFVKTLKPGVIGGTHAFSRELTRVFGMLPPGITHEDTVIAFRSILVGQIHYIDKPLIKYRLHGGNVFLRGHATANNLNELEAQLKRSKKDLATRIMMYETFLDDLQRAKTQGAISQDLFQSTHALVKDIHAKLKLRLAFLEANLIGKLLLVPRLMLRRLERGELKLLVRHTIPQRLLMYFLRLRSRRILGVSN